MNNDAKVVEELKHDAPDGFEILFRGECPYCHSAKYGVHHCEGVDNLVDQIKSQYKKGEKYEPNTTTKS